LISDQVQHVSTDNDGLGPPRRGSLHFLLRAFDKFNTGNSRSSCRQAVYQMALSYNFADVMQEETENVP